LYGSPQGKLSLKDNLKSIFPDFPDYAKKITIRHLLNHTSGIRDYLQISYLKGLGNDDFYVNDDIMKWLVSQSDLNFSPGEEHLYSNSGYWLLGQIVNKVAEMDMADFAKQEIFEPLGMNHTHFHNDHTQIVKNRASGYVPNDKDNYKISMTTLDMIGDGGIFTTINDIKKWDDAFYNSTVLSKAFWKEMTQQGKLNNGEVIDYASGLMVGKYKGLKTIRHGGAFVGFRAELLRFPEEKLSIAIFANRGDANPSRKANQVADIILKDKFVEPVVEKDDKVKLVKPAQEFEFKQLVGDYEVQAGVTVDIKAKRKKEIDFSKVNLNDFSGSFYSKELDATYNFEVKNEVLKVHIQDKTTWVDCTITQPDQFMIGYGLVRFQRTKGQISGFELDSGRVKNLKFHKK